MGKILILTEKPSVARDIAKVLGCSQSNNGYLAGEKYIVTWALGHLVTLADPETYGDRYKTWSLESLPMLPDKMELVVIKGTAKQFGIVKGLMNRQDIECLVIATDAGREGELVARWIIKKAGFRKPLKRLWISSQTNKAIKEGFASLKNGKEYDNLYMSAQCRAEADWFVGLNITRALTCKYNAQLSAGRVQTPTLAMIIQRENEIRKFVPRDYWVIGAKVKGFEIQWRDKATGQTQIFDKAQADEIVSRVKGQTGEILDVTREAKKEPPPLAYDLTTLQMDANRRYGYSAKKTLSIMQKLYEAHKLVSYPRTDSKYITDDIVPTLPERLKSIAVGPYTALARDILRKKIHVTKRLCDNSKVSDHHAIIPTEQYVDLGSLSQEERNIYDLIVRKFIATLNAPFEYEQTTVKVSIQGEWFYAKGKIIKSKGWKSVYQEQTEAEDETNEEEREQSLPNVQKGDLLKVESVKLLNRKTKPPARYTEATLLSAMEHPGKFIENEKLREAMENGSGLGTPATRADIIEKLFDSFYIERKGKEIVPTSKGIQLIGLVPPDLKSPGLTAKWEQQLQLISKGKAPADLFVQDIKKYASKLVSTVIASNEKYKHDNITREKCPECGKYLLDVNSKKGKMLVCPDRACGYRKGIARAPNARCPQCHKNMELRGEGEKSIFFCPCGYREKLSEFKKRKSETVPKKEVQKFLRQQDAGKSINTALADALAIKMKE